MPFIPLISATRPESRSTAPTNTRSALKRGDATRQCFLVNHTVRSGRVSGAQQLEPICGQQLDAVQVQCRWVAGSLFSERKPRKRQGSQLASSAQGGLQPDDAALQSQSRGTDREMDAATDRQSVRWNGRNGSVKPCEARATGSLRAAPYSACPSRIGPNSSHFSPENFIICTCSIG